jgi:hypothetical protein
MNMRVSTACVAFSILAATAAHADCVADIRAILSASNNHGPYHVDMSVTTGDAVTETKSDFIFPSSAHITSGHSEIVMTQSGIWMNEGAGLQRQTEDVAEQVRAMVFQAQEKVLESIDDATCLGQRRFESGEFQAFKYTLKPEGTDIVHHVDLFSDSKGRPVWSITKGPVQGQESLTRRHITYDDTIRIADPE